MLQNFYFKSMFRSNGRTPKTIEWLTDIGSYYKVAEKRSFVKQLSLKSLTTPAVLKYRVKTSWILA
jgi:hypothetical protein